MARRQVAKRPALTPSVSSGPTASRSVRARRQVERREAILAAALEEFSARGFAAARLDDVARRAGVAKGTIYLYFPDKESLFQELVRSMLSPVVGTHRSCAAADMPARAIAEMIVELFVREIYGTRRKDMIRLIITEGRAFPQARRVLLPRGASRASLPRCARCCARGCRARRTAERCAGAISAAPGRAGAGGASSGTGCSSNFEPLDVRALMRAHIDILFGAEESAMIRIAARRLARRLAALLAGCDASRSEALPGLGRGRFIFVGPDEAGRVETLAGARGRPCQPARPAVHARRRSAARRRDGTRGRAAAMPSRPTTAPRRC